MPSSSSPSPSPFPSPSPSRGSYSRIPVPPASRAFATAAFAKGDVCGSSVGLNASRAVGKSLSCGNVHWCPEMIRCGQHGLNRHFHPALARSRCCIDLHTTIGGIKAIIHAIHVNSSEYFDALFRANVNDKVQRTYWADLKFPTDHTKRSVVAAVDSLCKQRSITYT